MADRRLLVVCGAAATGKTAIRGLVASRLRLPSAGPDDFHRRWSDLFVWLDMNAAAVVECCRIHRELRRRLRQRGGTVVELTASEATRRKRLADRGDGDWLLDHGPIGYDDEIAADLTLDTDALSADDAAEWIVAAFQG